MADELTDDQLSDDEHAIRERIASRLGDPPRREKQLDELDPGEHVAYRQTGQLPETAEYREYERRVRRAAGLDQDASTDLESMSPADHDRRKYGRTP